MSNITTNHAITYTNGLPIKPSLITVDLNHMTPTDFIQLPFRVDLKLIRKTSSIGYFKKLLLHCFTNFTFTHRIVS